MSDNAVLMIATDEGWLLGFGEHAKAWGAEPELVDQAGVPLRPGHRRGWWIANERPTSVVWAKPGRRTMLRRDLTNPALHDADPARWPLIITPEQWNTGHWDDQGDDYTSVYDDPPPEPVVYDLAGATVIDGDRWRTEVPRFDDATLRRWNPDLVSSVLYSPELGPWLPGYLTGFRAHMATLLETTPNVTDVYCKRGSSSYEPAEGPYFNIRQMWSDGRTAVSGKGRQRRTHPTWITIKVPLSDVPLAIRGADLWDAVEAWERAEAEWRNRWDLIGAEACGHCNGRGWVKR